MLKTLHPVEEKANDLIVYIFYQYSSNILKRTLLWIKSVSAVKTICRLCVLQRLTGLHLAAGCGNIPRQCCSVQVRCCR